MNTQSINLKSSPNQSEHSDVSDFAFGDDEVNPFDVDVSGDINSADATALYLQEIDRFSLLTAEEEIELVRRVQQNDEKAKNQLVQSNLRLVVYIAKRYLASGIPLLDLIEEGNLGLMRAVEKFDPEKGLRFSTYAVWWIRQNVERSIMNTKRTIRIPVHVQKEMNHLKRLRGEFEQLNQRSAKPEELAANLGKDVDEIRFQQGLEAPLLSLDYETMVRLEMDLCMMYLTTNNHLIYRVKQYLPQKQMVYLVKLLTVYQMSKRQFLAIILDWMGMNLRTRKKLGIS